MTCKRALTIENREGDAAGVTLRLPATAVYFLIRVVDAARVPVAWEAARLAVPGEPFSFSAGEGWEAEDLELPEDLELKVTSAAGTTIEVILWA